LDKKQYLKLRLLKLCSTGIFFTLHTENAAHMNDVFNYGTDHLTVGKVIAIASGKLKATLNDTAIRKIRASQQHVQKIVENI